MATLQPFGEDGKPLVKPLRVEVISTKKFPTLEEHLAFFRALLDDLFALSARLPFTFDAPTHRAVGESLLPPSAIFTYWFLCHFEQKIGTAINIILSAPHRQLLDREGFVRLHEATEADEDVLLSILQSPQELVENSGIAIAKPLLGHAPQRVWQRLPEDTFDTPENRFVVWFLRQMQAAADALPEKRKKTIRGLSGLLRRTITQPIFEHVQPMRLFPSASQVLLRRDGYRDMLDIWRAFNQARRPFFGSLQEAIDLRRIDVLYEFWVFFRLVDEIRDILGEEPAVEIPISDERGLERKAVACFGAKGKLTYNMQSGQSTKFRSYSVELRPDFTWMKDNGPDFVLDAKFRMERLVPDEPEGPNGQDDEDEPEKLAKRSNLYKMQTYRDALRVRAAVALYPGNISEFWEVGGRHVLGTSLRQLLDCKTEFSGIGSLVLKPVA